MQAALSITQSPLRCHIRPASVRVSGKRVGATRKVAPTLCAPAFLTQKIADIRPEEQQGFDFFGIDLDASYDYILKCCKRFARLTGLEFDFNQCKALTKARSLAVLVDKFGEALENQFGIELYVGKKDGYGEELNILTCAVFRPGRELEEKIVVLYVSPARYLSLRSAKLFMRFMKFFSDSTNIPLGIVDNRENFYLDNLISVYYEDPMYRDISEEDEEYESVSEKQEIASNYREGGDFWNLFDGIKNLPKQDAKKLADDIDEYRKYCPNEELDFMENLLEGIDIVKDLNYYWFEFNPDDDGLPDEYGNSEYDGWSSSVFSSAILFSEQDGICDGLLEYINGEINSGIMMSGWNIHQYLSPDVKKSDIDDFMRCKDIIGKFSNWIAEFYTQSEVFDRYGKSEEFIE